MEWNWILEEYDDMVYVSDLNNYELLYVNRAGLDMFHLSREELFSGKKYLCYKIFHGRNTPCPFCTNNYLKDSGFYEWEHYNEQLGKTYLLKDRKVLWDGRESRIEFVFDVSKYKNKLDKQGKQQAAMLRSLPGGIARLDARDERTILWYGSEFLSIIGYTEEQFKEELQSQCLYVHPEDMEQAEAAMHEAKETGRSSIMQGRIVTRSGKIRHLTITFSYMDGKDSEDGIPSYYSLGIDVTETVERQRLQQQALEDACRVAKHANQGKTEFLSRMSHDIRTPMNAIVGMTAIAGAHIEDTQKVRDCLKKINTSSKHLLNLINEVLDMSKIESGKLTLTLEAISLKEVVEGVVGIIQPQIKTKKQNFDVHIENITVENVYCDSVRLNQVLLNLLSNATKYTPEGGSIQLSLFEEASPRGENFVRTHLKVKDNGICMSPEFLQRIYESYSRADEARIHKTEGAGLGMAITKYIVDAMGGTIDIQSELNKGTEFHITIDLEKAALLEADMVLPPWNMLVDDAVLCQTAVSALKSIGVNAESTLSGESAMKRIVQRHRQHNDYQIILLDWKLPDMDGLQIAREIRRSFGSEIPILLISAYDWTEFEEEAREAGISGFISKPLFKSTLFYGLRQYMGLEATHQPASSHGAGLSGSRVLLAEDNELNWEIASELLSDLGVELEWAEDGQICLDKFRESPEGYYILMDLRMPHMTGYEAAQAIRGLNRADSASVPIIAMTADAFAEDIQRCLECGMNAHIAKPIDVAELTRLLKKHSRKI